ncbi:hypothetical protein MG290_13380 [Flavobacterium sp. CBA20B-1]|uniref:DUF7010 family protein n=1 Tax=unclassified Flavobacterium TaxID=196869 RepID=UPI002224080D|nr:MULTISPECIES: hypothetical protein [unclassified Flavobacterium]WCM41916.1 hypothetical protein MG290_13380 [Flavobacterium sp. CBA20B-1]
MEKRSLEKLKIEIQTQAKKGIDFILSGGLLWLAIFIIWLQDFTLHNKSVFTFIIAALMLPIAFGLSKILKTNWKIKDNPLQPLGLWLNFAQIIYFSILIFVFIKYPNDFIMTYSIITGAHLFPYAWFYNENGYALSAILISVGALFIALFTDSNTLWLIPLFTSLVLFTLAIWIFIKLKKTKQ